MKSVLTVLIISFVVISPSSGQASKFAKTITEADLKERLLVLSHDSLEGRETGERGQRIAAEYIANAFKALGLEPPVSTLEGPKYLQKYPLKKATWSEVYMEIEGRKVQNTDGFLYYSQAETYGVEIIDIIFAEDLRQMASLKVKGKFLAFVNGRESQQFLELGKEMGVAGFVSIIEDNVAFQATSDRMKSYFKPKLDFQFDNDSDKILVLSTPLATSIFNKSVKDIQHGAMATLRLNADRIIETIESENVLGLLRGTQKPEEYLVITSHYDHVGIIEGEIHNGADDDGSGTATVIELAEAFVKAKAKGKGPKRSILFMTVSGEEKGLLGSKYYTDQEPIIPLEKTVVNLNIDMIGRIDEKHKGDGEYIYLIGSDKLSQELHDLSEEMNQNFTKLKLDYTYNSDSDPNRFYYRSDHYNFAKNNIPVIFYFNGTHEDYHRPTDTIEKIDFKAMRKRAQLIFHTGWEIANREEKIKLD